MFYFDMYSTRLNFEVRQNLAVRNTAYTIHIRLEYITQSHQDALQKNVNPLDQKLPRNISNTCT